MNDQRTTPTFVIENIKYFLRLKTSSYSRSCHTSDSSPNCTELHSNTYLDIAKDVTNVRLFARVPRSRPSAHRPIERLDAQLYRLRVVLGQSR